MSASNTTRSISRPARSARSRERNARSDGMRMSSTPGCRGVALMRSISCVTCRSNASAGPKRSGRAESRAGCAFLDLLRQTSDLDWTFLSPSAQFTAGERTGVFRLGTDTALRDANGQSWISYEDYAVALVDEIEQPSHSRCRFTVGY